NNEVHFLELHWVAESTIYEDDSEENEINVYPDFHGWGNWPKEDSETPIEGGIAIEFTPLRLLKDFIIKLNTDFKIYNTTFFKEKRKDGKKLNTNIILNSAMSFSLYELIGTVLSEVSFLGEPEDRDEAYKDLLESDKEYNNKLDEKDEQDNIKKSITNEIFGTDIEVQNE
ncbi:MAG: hypothetical protein J7L15_08735, partial [Clostridiales bacterium]|nr:hypothetical protein [Clostridiales bacterium]